MLKASLNLLVAFLAIEHNRLRVPRDMQFNHMQSRLAMNGFPFIYVSPMSLNVCYRHGQDVRNTKLLKFTLLARGP